MNRRLWMANRGALVLAALALACSSSSSGGAAGPKGRGTPACNQWQIAVCAFASKCNPPFAPMCQDQANAIACTSDMKATDCATALNAASCTAPPTGCDLKDLADPAPAMAACNQFIDEVCNAQIRCDPTVTSAACHQQLATQVDCTKMIGVKLTFEQCISDLKSVACTATMAPASCSGALLQTM
jgi:hypothetical protein